MAKRLSLPSQCIPACFGVSLINSITREFEKYAVDGKLEKSNICTILKNLSLTISLSDIDLIVTSANFASQRSNCDYLTLGELSLIIVEHFQISTCTQANLKNSKNVTPTSMKKNEISSKSYDVFLGGSCNPTSWRRDVAIPFLERHNITYYNPQVDEWYPELIQVEENAKISSLVKLFVFDIETRAISSLVETAYMSSIGWSLVIVLEYIPLNSDTPIKISGEILSESEIKDLNRGRIFLSDILQKEGVPVFNMLDEALSCILDIRDGRISYKDLVESRRYANQFHYGGSIFKLKQLFDKYATIQTTPSMVNVLTIHNAELATQEFTQTHHLPRATTEELKQCEVFLDFNLFCQLTAETIYQRNRRLWTWNNSKINSVFLYTYYLIMNTFKKKEITAFLPNSRDGTSIADVFLGGTCGSSTWRTEIVIPMLEDASITYYNPQIALEKWSVDKIPEENLAKKMCNSNLFVISDSSPSIASMTEISYLLGRGNMLFLVVEDVTISSVSIPYKLTPIACKDYCRGRAYLRKTAEMCDIKVYSTVVEATFALIEYLKKT